MEVLAPSMEVRAPAANPVVFFTTSDANGASALVPKFLV